MSMRSTYTTLTVRAGEIVAGEVVALGGVCFTRLAEGYPLTRHAIRQKQRFVEVSAVTVTNGWVEIKFEGGDCPANSRTMYALFRPFELLKVQVEKQ